MTRRNQDKGVFGSVYQLPSGRWRAQYYADGKRHGAPTTFGTKREAHKYLSVVESDIIRGRWLPPTSTNNVSRGQTLAQYSAAWLLNRMVNGEPLKDRTRLHYQKLLHQHILPTLGDKPLTAITIDVVEKWHAVTLVGRPTLRAHAYSLLRTILNTAVGAGKVPFNPCTIRGAGGSKRVITIKPATPDLLVKLVDAMPPRYQAMVLLASWSAMRYGELIELRRADVDVVEGVVHITRAAVYLRDGSGFHVTTSKSDAGTRDVHVPPHILDATRAHLIDHTAAGDGSLLFLAKRGGHLHPATLERHFKAACAAAGRPDLRFHDLRHSGAVLAAQTGATLAELMSRLGHSTVCAALRYQHATGAADRRIAEALSQIVAPGA